MSRGWIGNYAYHRARIDDKSIAIVDLDTKEEFTYLDLEKRANRLARVLRDDCEVKKGDRVAFVSRNRVELFDAFFATSKLGAILVPYNARLSSKELSLLIRSETPKVLFYEDVFEELIAGIDPEVKPLTIVLNDSEAGYESLVKTKSDDAVVCEELTLDDIHLIIHTGGTTGLPKGGLVSHGTLLFNSFNEICSWGLNHEDSAFLILPLFHTGGWNLLTLPLLHVGAKLYISRGFDPAKTLEVVEQEKTTLLFGAATLFRMIAEQPGFKDADLSSLRWAMAGAAPTPIAVMQEYWDKGVKFVLGYGMTEAGPNNLSTPAHLIDQEVVEAKYASVGKPMYLTLVKLVDEDGNEITEPDTPGEILWSGPQIFSGYWDNPEETEETLVDGWVHTGDMATRDEDGYYYIVGRKKNMFISGGENVFPPEVESALYDMEEVRECCVFGVKDEKWGEVGKTIISLRPGATLDKATVIDFLRSKLARYKVPHYVTFVDDIPKNNVGKIVLRDIIEIYGEPGDVQ
jgi:fatty-acyl-CoA synthase